MVFVLKFIFLSDKGLLTFHTIQFTMAEPTDTAIDSLCFLESFPSNVLKTASQTPDSTKKM